jgi:carbon starvation protein CstA
MSNLYPFIGPLFGLAWGLLWFGFWIVMVLLRRQERLRILDMVDQATREGRTLPPELLDRMTYRRRGPPNYLSVGLILIAVSLGMFTVGIIHSYGEPGPHPRLFWGPFGLFPMPLFIGLAFLVIGRLRRSGRLDL